MPDTTTVVLAGPDSTTVTMVDDEVTVVVATEGETQIVATGTTGPQGPAGPAGPPGAGVTPYVHTQAVAAAVWTVVHNLGYVPGPPSIRTSAGDWVQAEVDNPDVNTTVITFAGATSGTAYLK